jgi:nucleotide-binding universal stress UspA family protein
MVRAHPGHDDWDMTSAEPIHRPRTARHDGPLLICYDGSDHAKHAITSAAELLGDRRALIVTVWQPTADLSTFAGYTVTADTPNFAELDRAAAEAGGRAADEGVRIAKEAGLEAEPLAIKAAGPVWKTIVDTADDCDAAAIVMGSRGLTGVRSMLLGSVSNAVAHHTERPTLVIHRPSDDDGH